MSLKRYVKLLVGSGASQACTKKDVAFCHTALIIHRFDESHRFFFPQGGVQAPDDILFAKGFLTLGFLPHQLAIRHLELVDLMPGHEIDDLFGDRFFLLFEGAHIFGRFLDFVVQFDIRPHGILEGGLVELFKRWLVGHGDLSCDLMLTFARFIPPLFSPMQY